MKKITILLVLVILIIVSIFFILKQTDKTSVTSSENAGQPIAIQMPKSRPVSKAMPIQKINPDKIPQHGAPGEPVEGKALENKEDTQSVKTKITESDLPKPDMSGQKISSVQKQNMQPETKIHTPAPAMEQENGKNKTTQAEKKIVPEDKQAMTLAKKQDDKQESLKPKKEKTTPPDNTKKKTPPIAEADENTLHTLYGINFKESNGKFQMIILTDGPLGKYKYFILSKPDRLVLDLLGTWNKPQFLEKAVTSSVISRIRLWKYKDKLRIVGDLSSNKPISPTFSMSSDGLTMNISSQL